MQPGSKNSTFRTNERLGHFYFLYAYIIASFCGHLSLYHLQWWAPLPIVAFVNRVKSNGIINPPRFIRRNYPKKLVMLPNGAGAVHCNVIPVTTRAMVSGRRLPNLYKHSMDVA